MAFYGVNSASQGKKATLWKRHHYPSCLSKTPSDNRHADGYAKSYHVVLNEVFFGDMSLDQGKWETSEQRPHLLVDAVGRAIEKVENAAHNASSS
jgi:hypothetical protein